MRLFKRPVFALSPLLFGRGRRYLLDIDIAVPESLSDDARIFALTFIGGFLFMSVYLA